MSRTALVLAAHGSHVEPSTNALVRSCAVRIADMGLFDEVSAAFHQGLPGFAAVLDGLTADEATVVPFMTSEGYYCDVVLPRELKKNARYSHMYIRLTPPVGTHPAIIRIVSKRVRCRLREYNLEAGDTTLAIVGHGTERHCCSRAATVKLADDVRRLNVCGEVLAAFLDEEPGVETILARASRPNIVVVPFLIGVGPHATRDIPCAVGFTLSGDAPTPYAGHIGNRFVVCDQPLGTDPAIIEVAAQLARPDTRVPEEHKEHGE